MAGKGRDVIAGFSKAQDDRIDLSAIDAKAGSKKSDAFTFVGKADFSGTKGELRIDGGNTKTFFYGDVTGDGIADLAIELTGKIALGKGDFLLWRLMRARRLSERAPPAPPGRRVRCRMPLHPKRWNSHGAEKCTQK